MLLGPDLKEELPVLYLRLRDAVEKKRSRIIELSPTETGADFPLRVALAALQTRTQQAAVTKALADADIAEQLGSGNVVVVAGRPNLAESAEATVAALQALLDAIPNAKVLPALRRGNVVGALSLGLAPADVDHDGLATLQAAADGRIELLVLLGADPLNDCPDADLTQHALAGARRILSIDTFPCQVDATRRCRVGGGGLRREGGHDDQSGRPGDHPGPAGHRDGDEPHRLDDSARTRAPARRAVIRRGPSARGVATVDDVTTIISTTVPTFAFDHPGESRRRAERRTRRTRPGRAADGKLVRAGQEQL